MRLLIVTPPQLGHVRPALPIARALVEAGHRVAWATGEDALSHLAREPVEPVPCGLTATAARARSQTLWPQLDRLAPRDKGPAVRRYLFGEIVTPAMAAALEAYIDIWQPDAVLHDPLALAAPSACHERGVPCVEHAFGWPLPPLEAPHTSRNPIPPGAAPDLRIEIVPAALRGAAPGPHAGTIESRPVERPPAAIAALPESVRALIANDKAGPVVLASFGTAFHGSSTLRLVAEVLAALPVRSIVLGIGEAAPGTPPPNRQQHIAWLDQSAILPFCRLVVSHGGAGTVLGALAHGCPIVVLPQGADHFRNAAAVIRAGAGCLIEEPVDRPRLEAAIASLLAGVADRGASAAARAIAAMPSPQQAAARLVTLLQAAPHARREPPGPP